MELNALLFLIAKMIVVLVHILLKIVVRAKIAMLDNINIKMINHSELLISIPTAAEAVLSEKKFRDEYNTHYCNHVAACLISKDAALKMAKTGLEIIYNNFQYGDPLLLPLHPLHPLLPSFHLLLKTTLL